VVRIGRHRTLSGETAGARAVRPTWRCLYIDLHLDCPDADVDLGTIDHPAIRKAHDFAATYPANLIRVLEIRETMVFRYTHGRLRVATWLDENGIMWLCAADERDDDTYDFIVDLYESGELLPDERDSLRLEVEAAGRFVTEVREQVPRWVRVAREDPDKQHTFELRGGNTIRLFVRSGDLLEVWVALPTLTAGPGGLHPRMRGLILALIQEELGGDAEWSDVYDWPIGKLDHHEVAHLGIVAD
jgi:hypothetical protein